jgi:hypothetical protein
MSAAGSGLFSSPADLIRGSMVPVAPALAGDICSRVGWMDARIKPGHDETYKRF